MSFIGFDEGPFSLQESVCADCGLKECKCMNEAEEKKTTKDPKLNQPDYAYDNKGGYPKTIKARGDREDVTYEVKNKSEEDHLNQLLKTAQERGGSERLQRLAAAKQTYGLKEEWSDEAREAAAKKRTGHTPAGESFKAPAGFADLVDKRQRDPKVQRDKKVPTDKQIARKDSGKDDIKEQRTVFEEWSDEARKAAADARAGKGGAKADDSDGWEVSGTAPDSDSNLAQHFSPGEAKKYKEVANRLTTGKGSEADRKIYADFRKRGKEFAKKKK